MPCEPCINLGTGFRRTFMRKRTKARKGAFGHVGRSRPRDIELWCASANRICTRKRLLEGIRSIYASKTESADAIREELNQYKRQKTTQPAAPGYVLGIA